jgi:integrase
MPVRHLTDSIIKHLPAPTDRHSELYFDDACTGLLVRVTEAGFKSFVLSYRTTTGRQRRYTIGSCKDWSVGTARDHARELKKRIRTEDHDPAAELKAGRKAKTVADLCERFAEEQLEAVKAKRLRESTQRGNLSSIEREILPHMRHLKIADVTFSDCAALHSKITKRKAPYSANRVASLMHKIFTMSIRWGLRETNPATGIEMNHEEKRQRYPQNGELERLMSALGRMEDRQAADIVRVLLLTGARSHEVLGMRWDQLDFESGAWTKLSHHTKQKKPHRVPLSPAVLSILNKIERTTSEFVFPGTGKTGHRATIHKPWHRLMRDAKIEKLRIHDLRHFFASISASHGASLYVIGGLLGHTQPATTARYAHLLDAPLRDVAERVAAVVEGGQSAEVRPLRRRK